MRPQVVAIVLLFVCDILVLIMFGLLVRFSAAASRLLVTTRIKGILSSATEIALDLLSITESVELLAGVAELDASQMPPQLLQIAQLCGRLPLCLNITGKLIKTYGDGWEEDLVSLLKSDMKSLTQEEGDTMTMQQRVIQSGNKACM